MNARALQSADDNQRRAADPGASVFVTANAGSGKTKVLVDRIARLLLEGSKPSAFLCITYTKAAAAEMQRRLFERLGGWCIAEDAKLASDLTDLGANAANLGAARALFAQALETPGGLKIQTIHAFCERLLARFPLEAGVAPGFDVADEARAAALLGQARAEAALAADAPIAAFERFAARLGGDALDSLLDRLALRRADFHRFAATHKGGVFAEAQLRNRHGARQSAEFYAATVIGGLDWSGLRQAAEALISSTANNQKTARRISTAVDARAAGAPVRTVFEAVLRIALKDDGTPYEALVTASFAAQQAWLTRALESITKLAIAAREKLNQIERAEDAAAALQLALKLDTAYERAKQRGGVLDFDDLIAHAQALLARSDAAPWVLYKLDGGLDHILIDEGQDTSPGQWNLISPLQDEFFSGAGARAKPRTVFAVGDPKQSIYGFQGADPDRFLAEAQTLEKRARRAKQKFTAPVLETSFRSTPEILRAVDATFADKPLAVGEPGKHDETRHLASRQNEHGAVEVWPLAQRPLAAPAAAWDAPLDVETGASVQALLAQQIARRIKAMIEAREGVWDKQTRTLRPMQAGDVLALVRTRGALFRELIKAFKRAGLPVAGADRMVLRDELAVEDCLALMRVALDPTDDLALACVLKGPLCDLDDDDADILPLAWGRARGEVLHARLMANEAPKYAAARKLVSELAARAGQDAFAFLSWALETPHGEGPSGWERVLRRLGMESRDPLEELLQRALKPSSHNAVSLQRFLFEIEVDSGQVKRELEAETGAIRVMTVHGAKGLEAPVVILPDAAGPASDKPDDGLIFDEHAGPFISFRMRDDDAATGAARAAHQQRMLSEHWRLLYVAMTRARDRLIVCGAQHGAGEAPEGWRLAVEHALRAEGAEPCDTPYGAGLRLGAPVIAAAQAQNAKAHIASPTWVKSRAPGAIQVQSAAPSRIAPGDPALFSPRGDGQKRFRRGRLIHGLLERLPDIAPARRAAAAHTWLTRQGVKAEEAEVFAAEALAVITDARFADLFGPLSRAEAPIVGAAAGRAVSGVVDRLAVDDKRVIVLDYKTDRPAPASADNAPAEYVLQLALYREVLRKIFPHRIVTCALLWTEAPLLMELPGTQLDAAFALFERG
jgi:ATP-dependent helicase/nuclease subunit A